MAADNSYCHRCGERLTEDRIAGAARAMCPACGNVVFIDPKLAVVVVASLDSSILMVKRDIEPMMGRWSFPAGYVDRGEVVEEAAVREVKEETNVDVELDGLLGVYSSRGAPVVLVAYAGTVVGGRAEAGDEVQETAFFPPDQLPPLPFPHDDQIIRDWTRDRCQESGDQATHHRSGASGNPEGRRVTNGSLHELRTNERGKA